VRGFERAQQDGDANWEVLLDGTEERIPVSRRQQHVVREFSK
jgi:two-component system response regulator AlgR